jgi:Ala-tRNA(Pro) deacylase
MDDTIPPVLEDGSTPATSDELLEYLQALGIDAVTHEHEPVFTVEEAQAAKGDLPGAHTKNLFVRDKRGRMWIVVALHDRELDLLALSNTLRSMGLATGRLSFGSRERLMRFLGLTPGAVSPFALINDHGGQVRVALDTGLRGQEVWNAHPLTNDRTTALRTEDMLRFLEAVDHPPVWIEV